MTLVGYARVSSVGQSLEVQLDKLKHCKKIYQEKKSAIEYNRPQLKACLDYVRDGDTLVITKLDRLARSTLHLCQLAEILAKKEVSLQVLDQNIDTTNATGRLLFNMLGAISQFETELRSERQVDGIKKAMENGTIFGKKKKLSHVKINELIEKRKKGTLIKDLMSEYQLSKASIYRYISHHKKT